MNEWKGYPRPDGSFGARNYVGVLPSVACANSVAKKIAENVKGAIPLIHNTGCALTGKDAVKRTVDTLVGLGLNPNVHSLLIVGLGCETIQSDKLADKISRSGKEVYNIIIQDQGTLKTIEKGIRIVKKLIQEASVQTRQSTDISTLIIGTECGGSDWSSGIISNPILGYAADIIVNNGGTVILSETTEFFGAEHLLIKRAFSSEVKNKILEIIRRYEQDIINSGGDIYYSNPSYGNIQGGITTIEEKALGAILKGGTSKIMQVVEYGEKPSKKGLIIMDTPGYDIISITGMAAGGAQVIVFTTGRGNHIGFPIVPVIKITGNPLTYEKMMDDIDIYVGEKIIRRGVSATNKELRDEGKKLVSEILEVASGKKVKSEIYGYNELQIWRRGIDL